MYIIILIVAICWILSLVGAFSSYSEYSNIVSNSSFYTIPIDFIKRAFNFFIQNIYACLLVICSVGIIYNSIEKSRKFIKYFLIGLGIFIIAAVFIFITVFEIYKHIIGLGVLFGIC